MIGYDEMATACRENDGYSERGLSLDDWGRDHYVHMDSMVKAAEQRALRVILVTGRNYSVQEATAAINRGLKITLSPDEQETYTFFAACWIDGFSAGIVARDDNQEIHGEHGVGKNPDA